MMPLGCLRSRLAAGSTVAPLALAFFALPSLASAQIPAAEILLGGPGGPELFVLSHLDADATGSWALGANQGTWTDPFSLFGFLAGSGMTGPGLIRAPQTLLGIVQGSLDRPSVRGAEVGYIASYSTPSSYDTHVWIDDQLITRRGDSFGTAGLTWYGFGAIQLTGDGRALVTGIYSEGSGFSDAVVDYPSGNVLLQTGMSFPGLPNPVELIYQFHSSPGGQHWCAPVTYRDPDTGSSRSALIVDGAVHRFYDGSAAIWGARPPFADLSGIGSQWGGFYRARVTDSGEVAIEGSAGTGRLIVRNGRLVQRITAQPVGLADMDSDGTVLVRNDEPNGLSSDLDGLPLGREGVSQVDVDRDGVVDAGWEIRPSSMGLLPRLGAFEEEGRALVAIELTGPVPGLYRAIARATLAQPKVVVCNGEPSSLGRPVNLRLAGSDLVALNDLTLTIADLPPQSVAITIFSRDTGFVPMAAGGLGTLCLGGSIGRGSIVSSGLGLESNIHVPLFTDAIPQPTGPVAGLVGETWTTQAWYRDQLPTGGATNNFSDAISFTFR